ncbi:unnamed protein product [Fraxinus pennsylvanica]|uniref:NAD-dependent epimerase/dehydratase domain-containing protein n=1 Tax=Fraxinus pennsylvanica TaxID=56036 RepID=A0AAD2E0C9_9LAMI|nr:unnamed protein product [Fraxinus pennsylvanica]
MSKAAKTVCVTGASGYIASWIVKFLLQRGYTVKASIRDPDAEPYPNATFGWVNVKDVATAHILAFENPSANGRYLLVESVAHYSEIVKILHELYPALPLPEKCADDKPFVPKYQVSKEKAKSLGIEFTSLKESIKETVESLKEKNFFGGSSAK